MRTGFAAAFATIALALFPGAATAAAAPALPERTQVDTTVVICIGFPLGSVVVPICI